LRARAPDAGEDSVRCLENSPHAGATGVQEHDGFTYLSKRHSQIFRERCPHDKGTGPYAEHNRRRPIFGGRTTVAAWRSKPSWYAVPTLDQTISPDLERFLAARMKATTVELEAGHLSLVPTRRTSPS